MPSELPTIAELQELETKYENYQKIRYPGYTFQGKTRPAKWLGSSWREKVAYISRQSIQLEGISVYKKGGHRVVGVYSDDFMFNGVIKFAPDAAREPASAFVTNGWKSIKTMDRTKSNIKKPALQIVSSLDHSVKPDPSTKDTVVRMTCHGVKNKADDIVKELQKYMTKLPQNQSSIKLRLLGHGHGDGGNDFSLGSVGARKILQAIVDKKNDIGEQQFTNITISDGSCGRKIAQHFEKALELNSVQPQKYTTIGIRAANSTDLTLLRGYKKYQNDSKLVPSLITTSATGEPLTRKLEVHKLVGYCGESREIAQQRNITAQQRNISAQQRNISAQQRNISAQKTKNAETQTETVTQPALR